MIADHLGDFSSVTKERFHQKVAALNKLLQETRNHAIRQVQSLESSKHKNTTTSDKMTKRISLLVRDCSERMVKFAGNIIESSIELVDIDPPCDFAVIGLGSLGRAEATPYSDLEYLFLISDSSKDDYFEHLAVMSYFLIGALRETKLGSVDIEELKEWFVDGRNTGFQVDGITETSGNVPTGNTTCPNKFISTPGQLLKRYQQILQNPQNEAVKGDMTSMLRFMTPIYFHRNGKTLLEQFIRQRNELDKEANFERQNANFRMLTNDLQKYKFAPEFNEYTDGFSMSIKKLLYRFPSLLLHDLVVLSGQHSEDSWSTLRHWTKMLDATANDSFPQMLKSLLASACFARQRCCLNTHSTRDVFEVSTGDPSPKPVTIGDSKECLIFNQSKGWKMAADEFLQLCEGFLHLHAHVTLAASNNSVEPLLRSSVEKSRKSLVMANFYSSHWTTVIRIAEKIPLQNQDNVIIYANARSLLQTKNYQKAQDAYKRLISNQSEHPSSVISMLEIMRGLARCFCATGKLPEALKAYKETLNQYRDSDDQQGVALLKVEFANVMVKINSNLPAALRMLFEALQTLVIGAATESQNLPGLFLDLFEKSGYYERLEFLCNPTRGIAHCAFSIGEIFRRLGEAELSNLYFTKARALGLRMVINHKTDALTKVMILHEIGVKCETQVYMGKALEILYTHGLTQVTDHAAQQEVDILISMGELSVNNAKNNSTALEDLPEDFDLGTRCQDKCPGADVQHWYRDTKEKLQRQHKNNDNHYDFGKLYHIQAALAASKGKSADKVQKYFQKALRIFSRNNCVTEISAGWKAQAELCVKEMDFGTANEMFEKAQMVLEGVLGENVNSVEYREILVKRSEVLCALGEESDAKALYRKALKSDPKYQHNIGHQSG